MNHRSSLRRSSMLRRPTFMLGAVAFSASAMLMTACGSDSADTTVAADTAAVETSTVATDTVAAETAAAGDTTATATASSLTISGAWARTSPMMKGAGAMYATISNGGDAADALLSVSVPAEIAAKVELHETVAVESMDSAAMGSEAAMAAETTMAGAMGSEAAAGSEEMMTMRPVEMIEIPAKGEAVLAPGGLHIMLLEMPTTLATGSTFEATFTFRDGGEQKVQVEVRDQ